MFTGIVEEIGAITAVEPSGDGVRITVRAPKAVSDAGHGDSISVSGVCLTVVDQGADWFTADVMKQTLAMSTLQRSPTAGRQSRACHRRARPAGGHIVQGHIDGTGDVLAVHPGEQWRVLRIGLPAHLAPLVVDKGSIAIDGVSLTVSAVRAARAGEHRICGAMVRGLAHPRDALGHDSRQPVAGRPGQPRDRHPGATRPAIAVISRLRPHPRSARPPLTTPQPSTNEGGSR